MCDKVAVLNDDVRAAERVFAKALRDENMRLKRELAAVEAARAEYLADIEVEHGKVVFNCEKVNGYTERQTVDDSGADAGISAQRSGPECRAAVPCGA